MVADRCRVAIRLEVPGGHARELGPPSDRERE
jgi:hypothetical protein